MRNLESDVIDVQAKGDEQAESLKTIGWISYLLHLIVAVAAVVPGAQVVIGILLVALVIDLVKKSDAAGTWQASHFSLAHPFGDLGGRALPGDLAAVPAVPGARHGSPGP